LKKLSKYLKPFLLGLVLAIVLLFVQAVCDLSLPNYMSDIVNVGIQQNGIEHASPGAISRQGMDLMRTLMPKEDAARIDQAYRLVFVSDTDEHGAAYAKTYPAARDQLYVRQNADESAQEALDTAFGRATWTLMNVLQGLMQQSGEEANALVSIDAENFDLQKLYDLQPVLQALPQQVMEEARQGAQSHDESMVKQSGIMLAQAFYDELGADIGAMQSGYIFRIGLWMLLVALLGGVATVLVSLLSSRIAAGVARNLRRDIFAKIESFSSQEFDEFSTASLITRCTNDVTQIQLLLTMGIRMICYAPIMAVGGILMAVNKSPSMSWVIAVACVALLGLIMVVMSFAMPKFKILQKLVDKLNLVSREGLSGMMVIRAFGTQAHEQKRFEKANDDLTKTNLFVNRVMVFMMPVMMLIMNGITLLIVWVGAHQISQATMQVGDMMAFMQYAMQIIMSFLMISIIFIFVPRAAISAERIAEVLEKENTIKDPASPKAFDDEKRGIVEFKHVHFRYHNAEEDALYDIDFTAYPGQTTAIIGSTGSGKSTIANLIMRLYDVTKGQVLVCGVDVKDVTQHDLRARIGFVPQKGVLLSGTIESNIKYGAADASRDIVERSAAIAQAEEFIEGMDAGYDAAISQGGTNVSGGQRQRLAIARALAKQPDILIFDDSFSALDFKTDAALRKALKENIGHSTLIVVAQRVNTIMHAEQILVVDQGRIVGRGTHTELLKSCPEYLEIASSQLSKEELA
jgi:ATP-binding cassette subfamily B multidrug efflux pump